MLKDVFAKAEEVKKKLKEKFEHEEKLRREEEVGIYLEANLKQAAHLFIILPEHDMVC